MVTTVMHVIRITPPPSALPGGLRDPVREQRRIDTGALQHLDGPALLVCRQRGEQIKTPARGSPRSSARPRAPSIAETADGDQPSTPVSGTMGSAPESSTAPCQRSP